MNLLTRLSLAARIAPFALVISGCAHVMTATTLNADGSFQRQETFSVHQMYPALGFNSYFHFRAENDKVTYRDESKKSQLVVTRQGVAGSKDPIDIVVVGKDRKPLMSSRVTVTKGPDGNILYTERLHWLGVQNSFDLTEYFGNLDQIKAALPPAYRTEKIAVALTGASSELMNGLLFGPPRPYYVKALANSQLTKIQLLDPIEDFLNLHKQEWFPGISDDDLNRLARSIMEIFFSKHVNSTPSEQDVPSLTPLAYVVSPPGKVLETNGAISKDGRVFWSLIPLASMKHDILLTLLCRPAP